MTKLLRFEHSLVSAAAAHLILVRSMRAANAFVINAMLATSFLAGCSRGADTVGRKAVRPDITSVLDNSTQFVLLSVDPLPVSFHRPRMEPKDVFHGHTVLGQTEIRDKAQRAALLRALYKGIGESGFSESGPGTGHACFNPRHGIHASNGSATVDLLICFECWWVRAYTRDGEHTITTTDSPQSSFDDALNAAHVPLPEGPNQAMQSTARRRTASLSMTKELPFQFSFAATSGD